MFFQSTTFRTTAFACLIAGSSLVVGGSIAQAKQIRANATTSQRLTLRVDGLACYFCAYGLERAFKKSGRVSAFDIDMDTGQVFIDLAAGQPLLTLDETRKIIYQAGYTPRDDVGAAFRGHILIDQDQPFLALVEVTGRVSLGPSEAIDAWMHGGSTDHLALVTGPIRSGEGGQMVLTPTTVELAK